MKKRWLPRYVSEFHDRHGKPRYRFRRKGQETYYFKSAPGTPAFGDEYGACMEGVAAPAIDVGADRTTPGSFNDLLARFYRSPEWLDPSDRTRAVYRGVLEAFRRDHGHRMVAELQVRHVEAILAKKADTPTAANILRKLLARLMAFAIRQGMRRDNPVTPTRPYKVRSEGFHTWAEDEIARFEARHRVGTRARLALALMLYTGQRRSDVVRMGRQHIEAGRIRVRQQKTGTLLAITVHPHLLECIAAMPADHLTFLTTAQGRSFSPAGFGNWFRQRCDEAGLPHCSAHGLRKAAARRLAELGLSNQLIKSVTGHKSDSEVARYTRGADQVALADQAIAALARWEMANPSVRLAIDSGKRQKGKA